MDDFDIESQKRKQHDEYIHSVKQLQKEFIDNYCIYISLIVWSISFILILVFYISILTKYNVCYCAAIEKSSIVDYENKSIISTDIQMNCIGYNVNSTILIGEPWQQNQHWTIDYNSKFLFNKNEQFMCYHITNYNKINNNTVDKIILNNPIVTYSYILCIIFNISNYFILSITKYTKSCCFEQFEISNVIPPTNKQLYIIQFRDYVGCRNFLCSWSGLMFFINIIVIFVSNYYFNVNMNSPYMNIIFT